MYFSVEVLRQQAKDRIWTVERSARSARAARAGKDASRPR